MELHSRVLTLAWIDQAEGWELTDSQKLLLSWLLMCFDTNGVIEFNPILILKRLDLKHLKSELEILFYKMIKNEALVMFDVDGKSYGFSKLALQSQNLRAKAKLPCPPFLKEIKELTRHVGYKIENVTVTDRQCPSLTAEGNRIERNGIEEKNIKDKNVANALETIENIRQNQQARSS